MMILKISRLDPDTYCEFCFWLREEQGTTIGSLIKQSGQDQDRMLTKFIIERKYKIRNESN